MSAFRILKLFFLWSYAEFTMKFNNFRLTSCIPFHTFRKCWRWWFSYIVGCKFVAVEELLPDLTAFAYLLVNETVKRKLNGSSRRLNENTFQLPQHIFVTPGKYQYLIEARSLYNKTILSESSAYIPMPGRIVLLCCRFCKSEN